MKITQHSNEMVYIELDNGTAIRITVYPDGIDVKAELFGTHLIQRIINAFTVSIQCINNVNGRVLK